MHSLCLSFVNTHTARKVEVCDWLESTLSGIQCSARSQDHLRVSCCPHVRSSSYIALKMGVFNKSRASSSCCYELTECTKFPFFSIFRFPQILIFNFEAFQMSPYPNFGFFDIKKTFPYYSYFRFLDTSKMTFFTLSHFSVFIHVQIKDFCH